MIHSAVFLSFARRLPVLLLSTALAATAFSNSAWARVLHVCHMDRQVPPFILMDREGSSQKLARQAVEHVGDSVEFHVVPLERCKRDVANGTMDAILLISFVPPSHANYRPGIEFPMTGGDADPKRSVANLPIVLLRRAGSGAYWDGIHLTGVARPVLYRGGVGVIAEKLTTLGVTSEPAISGGVQLLRMLVASRGDLGAIGHDEAEQLLATEEFRGKLEILPQPLVTANLYLAFNEPFYKINLTWVESIWAAIARIQKTTDWVSQR